jgi:choline-sulfatase
MTTPSNLIFFLSDNHAGRMLGSAGHPTIQTPNLDKIAARGVRFSNAYCASPLCSPSRASLATGRYPHQTGFWDNAIVYDGSVPSWHHRIREQGHEVTAIGKLHYRSEKDDNGFSDEIIPLHIFEERGALITSLRATEGGMPQRTSHRKIYEDSGEGEADYQIYDREITDAALSWLREHSTKQDRPWVLLISYPSPHPPFRVPEKFWDLYPLDEVSMPVQWQPNKRPKHPAVEYLLWMNSLDDGIEEELLRRVIAGYCALISHVDDQIGTVLQEAESLGLMGNTRILYTSDHGEAAGNHGILGKAINYEHSINVPLIMSGPGIPHGQVIDQTSSHVDLFHTIVESVGAKLSDEDQSLMGTSLWPAINGSEEKRIGFTEFHAMGSKNAGFSIRDERYKLIYHVDMPNQLFDLHTDPQETNDLLIETPNNKLAQILEAKLREIVDPEALDEQVKSDQLDHAEKFGGLEAVRKAGTFAVSPIPGKKAQVENV